MQDVKVLGIDELNAAIEIKEYVEVDGKRYYSSSEGKYFCYMNSPSGREQLVTEQNENIVDCIFAIWGDSAIIDDPIDEDILPNEETE